MNTKLEQKIRDLKNSPGVYVFRDSEGKIIYVGKAAKLKNRVSSYFIGSVGKDPKTAGLISRVEKLSVIECNSEFEAFILESELIKRYKPRYNIRLKDDKSHVYIKISRDSYPRISVVRQIEDEEAKYLGPFVDARAVRTILKEARKIFPFCSCRLPKDKVCLYYHLNLCQGHGEKYITVKEYKRNISGLVKLFGGKTKELEKSFRRNMETLAKKKKYETAANYRDKLIHLEKIKKSHFIPERSPAPDEALKQLKKELKLKNIPNRIECFDVSNIAGTAAVGSMVVFINGVASPKDYLRFRIKNVNAINDYAMMAEILSRRFKNASARKHRNFSNLERNQGSRTKKQKLPNPNLVVLDGGKGHLSAALQNVIFPEGVEVVSLSKRNESIYYLPQKDREVEVASRQVKKLFFARKDLPKNSEAYFLMQRIRDEAHRFAVTYHRKVRSKDALELSLDLIPGVGPKTRKNLIRRFGSIKNIKNATEKELSGVVGSKLAQKIKKQL